MVTSLCSATIASAMVGGLRSLAGRFTHSRVAFTAAASSWARSNAAVASPCRAIGLSTTTSAGSVDSVRVSFLYVSKV